MHLPQLLGGQRLHFVDAGELNVFIAADQGGQRYDLLREGQVIGRRAIQAAARAAWAWM